VVEGAYHPPIAQCSHHADAREVDEEPKLAGLELHDMAQVAGDGARVGDHHDVLARMRCADFIDGGAHARDHFVGSLYEFEGAILDLEGHLGQSAVDARVGADRPSGFESSPSWARVDGHRWPAS